MTEMDHAAEQELLDGAHEGGDLTGGEVKQEINEEELLGEAKSPSMIVAERRESAQDDDVDLYDEAVAPSLNISDDNRRKSSGLPQLVQQTYIQQQHSGESTPTMTAASASSSSHTGKYNCYIGNLTWWTTDADLHVNIAALGVQDILDIKFFENRINGQSKGFALCSFSAEASLKTVMEQIGNRAIHGAKPAALAYTKQSLAKLEDAAAKTQTRPDQKKKEENCLNMGTIRIGAGPAPQPLMMRSGPPPGPQPLMSRAPLPLMINGQPAQMQPLMGQPIAPPGVPGAPIGMQAIGQPRPLMQTMPTAVPQPLMGNINVRPPGVYSVQPQPLMGGLRPGMGLPPPGAHVNPNIFPMGAGYSEAEFEEIMNRNRTVSSSAIQRAISDAHAGDVKAAVETLQTAMNLIKSSRVAHDDRCRLLVVQLDDCLRQIDKSGYGTRGSRSYPRRSRSRSRDRKRRHRSRSDSRSRSPPRHSRSRRY